MAEDETQIEMPIEPHITNPKSSPIIRASGHFRAKGQLYREVSIVAPISKAKFPVYLAKGDADDTRRFAMKVFPLDDDNEPSAYFKNEARFASLSHENIIKTLHVEHKKSVTHNKILKTVSFILFEYAPYGDFFSFITKYRDRLNEKLIRTYFRQLIEGLEYLHRKNVSHLDLKLENLLLGEDFTLKIADFDLSYIDKDPKILTTGTKFYRSPELMVSACKDCPAADIYSAGVLLFVFKTGGVIPHSEEVLCRGVSLVDLLHNDNAEFWKAHCTFQQKSMSFFSPDFRTLFNGMTKLNPEDRFSLNDIKDSNWYNGPVYTEEDLKEYVKSFIQ